MGRERYGEMEGCSEEMRRGGEGRGGMGNVSSTSFICTDHRPF